jgi:uncharacterized protein
VGARDEYGPGTFCWANLSSTDPEAAMRFYAGLFGWDYEERPADGGGFVMARRGGAEVAAIYPREPDERDRGLAPHWNNYVSVTDADAAVGSAAELGASVFEEPYDVSDAGRTAVLIDPVGAMFWVWQPRRHIGARRVNDVGCLTFNELVTADVERSMDFYSALFGWTFEPFETGDGSALWVIGNDTAANGLNGAMRELSDDGIRAEASMWLPYFTVPSVSSATVAAEESGGRHRSGPVQAGEGRTAVVADPTGAAFGLFEGDVDD